MNHTYVGQTEHFINGLIDFGVQSNGCKRLAYPPVVAGGENAIILHYISNDDVLRSVIPNLRIHDFNNNENGNINLIQFKIH